jgi:uncharacterized protein (DUF2225 family)
MELNALLKLPGVKRFPKGSVIVAAGDAAARSMYIILQGNAGIFENYHKLNEAQTASFEAGGFFGEMNLFLNKTTTRTAAALTDVVALEVHRANAYEFFAKQPEITFSLFESLCRRLDAPADATRISLEAAPKEKQEEDVWEGTAVSGNSPLFPDGHGNYLLLLDNTGTDYLYSDAVTCPICSHSFHPLAVMTSKLKIQSKDDDMRVRYKDIEPMYYEVVSCPECLYSATPDLFPKVETTRRITEALQDALAPYRGTVRIHDGARRDTFTVFAGYYLAILSAGACFSESQRITGRLWRNLSRIYDDCSDEKMMRFALEKSKDAYEYAYKRFDNHGKALQQLCYMIGETLCKLDEPERAREYLYAAFTNKEGTAVLKRQAENKLDEVKKILKAREEIKDLSNNKL